MNYDEDEDQLVKIDVLYHKGEVDPKSYSIEESIKHELKILEAKALQLDNKSFHKHLQGMRKNKDF